MYGRADGVAFYHLLNLIPGSEIEFQVPDFRVSESRIEFQNPGIDILSRDVDHVHSRFQDPIPGITTPFSPGSSLNR
jgi:hypothetical protein